MARAFLLVLDSVGIGAAPDAECYGDAGSDTVGHIAEACARGEANGSARRRGPLHLPHLAQLGLGEACRLATGRVPPGLESETAPQGRYAAAAECAKGKDTPSGHWEIAGVALEQDWYYFPHSQPAFPTELVAALCQQANLPGILGDCHASGTEIIARLGAEHRRTGRPICYTSADSVFQIAAHEESFGLARLYEVCAVARTLCDPLRVGRVIARPFVGDESSGYTRTGNRRDYTMPPPRRTLLSRAAAAGREIVSIGKIADIFAHCDTGRDVHAFGNDATMDAVLDGLDTLPPGGLLFANFNDFDTLYGHRRDVGGYAAALESFDLAVPALRARLRAGDIVVITADHGCDPTWRGTDHTREHVPVLAFGPGIAGGSAGQRESFADIGSTLAKHLGLQLEAGTPFL
jgi:phosphopentomutase